MAHLFIPTPLRKFTDGQSTFTNEADRVGGLLQAFVEAYSAVHPHLYDETGSLRSFIRIYVGDEDLEALDGLETPLDQRLKYPSFPPSLAALTPRSHELEQSRIGALFAPFDHP